MPRPAVLAGGPLLIAHRGGSDLAPENTLAAFRNAAAAWRADMIELDVHASADGYCVVIHDPTVDRTTDGSGAVAGMTLAQLREFDAGYRFTDAHGAFAFRGRDVRIPTIEEVLEALPGMRVTVEVKVGTAQTPLFDAIRRFNASDRVIAAGMHARDRTRFSDYRGAVSASAEELRRFYVPHRLGAGRFFPPRADVVQVPETWDGRRVVTPRFVRDLAARGIPVHVWTVNDESDMHRLLDWGVDGLITDRPDVLGRVLHARVGRPLTPAHGEPGAENARRGP
jgi:glycerophosphoryl diester phosphodiesterase